MAIIRKKEKREGGIDLTISRSNFIAMSVTMLAILFLFQFSNLSVLYTSKATINHIAEEDIKIYAKHTVQKTNLKNDFDYSTAIIGDSYEANLAVEWCVYMKRNYARFDNLQEFYTNTSTKCRLLIVNSYVVTTSSDIKILQKICDYKINIIFTSLPDTELIQKSETLKSVLGIHSLKTDSFRTSGMTIYDGFLLGGRTSYKKLKKTIPYFKLQAGVKAYIVGEIKDQKKKKIKNEDLPPILWRYHTGKNFIFAVNTDFFSNHTGLGMMTSMLAETEEYLIYPIVNAQSVICQNYPYLSNENTNLISEKYYYETQPLSQSVLWPDIISILDATGEKFSGMIAPKFEYSNSLEGVSSNTISYYYKQTEQVSGNLGISGDQVESGNFYKEKLKYDTEMFKQKVPSYVFTIFSPGKMPETIYKPYLTSKKENILSNIRTMIIDKDNQTEPVISFYNDKIISMANVSDGFSHDNDEDLYLKSIETALGYSSVSLDFTRVYYPSEKKDDWTRLTKNLSRFLDTYWAEFRKGFEQTTVSEADEKARRFLALDYQTFKQGNTINLSIDHFYKSASFILKMPNGRITSITGGEFKKLEQNVYVINASKKDVVLTIADEA